MGLLELQSEFTGKSQAEIASFIGSMPESEQTALYAELSELDRISREERLHLFRPTSPPDNDQRGFLYAPGIITTRFAGGSNRSGKTEIATVDKLLFARGVHPIRSFDHIPPLCQKYIDSKKHIITRTQLSNVIYDWNKDHILDSPAWLGQKPPVKIREFSPSWEDTTIDVTMRKLREFAPRKDLAGGSFDKAFSYSNRSLTFKNGSQIRFFNYTQTRDKMGGADVDALYFDEHAPREIYEESKARTADRGGFVVYTMTPEGGATWELDDIIHADNPTVKCWFFLIEKNPYVSKVGREEFKASIKDPNLLRAKYYGEFVVLQGMVYPEFSRDNHVIPDFDLPTGYHRQIIVDSHLRTPTAILWMATSPKGVSYVYREAKWNPDTDSGGIPRMVEKIRMLTGNEYIHQFIIDEAMGGKGKNINGHESVKMQLIKCGLPFMGTNQVGGKNFEAGVNLVRTALSVDPITGKPRLFFFESCEGTIKQHERYRFRRRTKADEETLRESVATVDDHFVDDVRYGLMASPQISTALADKPMIILPKSNPTFNYQKRQYTRLGF